ncbi:MAG: hypothetical protein WD690_14660 [Vicinamibacterales bacterium]
MTTSTCLATRRAHYIWLVRGAIGLALLAVAVSTHEPLVAIPALAVALIAFRAASSRKEAP